MPRSRRAGARRIARALRFSDIRKPPRLQTEQLEARNLLSVTAGPVHLFADEGFLSPPSEQPVLEIVDEFLERYASELAATPDDFDEYRITDLYTSESTGLTHVYLRQQFAGLDVLGADLNVNLTADGQIVNVGASFLANLAEQAGAAALAPALSAVDAVEAAARGLGYSLSAQPQVASRVGDDPAQITEIAAPGLSLDEVPLQLSWAPTEAGIELAWSLVVRTPDGRHWYDLAVAADNGELVWQNDWGDGATYSALPIPVEAPHDGSFAVLTDIHDPTASPFGWHDTDGVAGADTTLTRGNNVNAHTDLDNNNQSTDAEHASGGAGLDFQFPFNPTGAPLTNRDASITNLYVFNNLLHDVLYHYGFNEVAGNFQVNNYGRGGLGNDAVEADALDGSGTDNANFFTPPDGSRPRMQMYIWNAAGNRKFDSSFDNGIIAHEFGHGLSNRLTGGPGNSNALRAQQSGGMGEGWSDWLALMLLQRPEDQKNDAIGIGTYVLGQSTSGAGIRRHPYSFDMEVNPHTFAVYNASSEEHDAGEIWASTLWDLNWILIDKYGYDPDLYHGDGGNNLTMQLVLDGMKLQPANPSFLQARDAILLADRILTDGANQVEIWTAFARRGMGFYAEDGGSESTVVVESFVVPDLGLHVVSSTPADGELLTTPTTAFTIQTEADIDPASIDAGDFLLNGVAADSVTVVDPRTLTFHYVTSPAAVEGVFTLSLPGDSLSRASDGDGLTPYSATFRYDTLQLEVVASRPSTSSVVTLPLAAIEFDFNEPVAPGSLHVTNLALNRGTVAGVEAVDADTVRYLVSGLESEDTLLATLRGGSITDLSGNPTLAYSTSIVLDIEAVALPELVPVAPAGSLVYRHLFNGILGSEGDVDEITMELDAGQRVTVLLDPMATVSAQIEVMAPGGSVLATSTVLPGNDGLLEELSAATSGEYRVRVTHQAGSGLGAYRVIAMLNASVEAETANGAANDTVATAERIDDAFSELPQGGSRAAVLGFADIAGGAVTSESEPNETIPQADSVVADFAAIGTQQRFQQSAHGSIAAAGDEDWYFVGALGTGDSLTIAALGATSGRGTLSDSRLELWRANGGAALRVDHDDNGGGEKEAQLYRVYISESDDYFVRVAAGDGLDVGDYQLTLWLEDFGADPASGVPFGGEIEGNNSLGSANDMSQSWRKANYYSRIDGSLTYADRDVFQMLLKEGDTVTVFGESTSTIDLGLRLYDAQANLVAEDDGTSPSGNSSWIYSLDVPASGLYFVEYRTVAVRNGGYKAQLYLSTRHDPPVPTTGDDFYVFSLADGERISAVADSLEFGHVEIAIANASGSQLVAASPGARSALDDWEAPAAGDYLVHVRGVGPYNLVLTRGAGFDSRGNATLATAQRLDDSGRMLGAIESGDVDVYHFVAAAGQMIEITTATPGGGAQQPMNGLDPRIELYDPSGTLVAADDDSADGRNARIAFAAPAGGNYRIRVLAEEATQGEYTLEVMGMSQLPTVRDVTLGNTTGHHADYVVPAGSGEQLRTVPVGFVNRVAIRFNHDVQVAADDLTIQGLRLGGDYTITGFAYDPVRFVATWTFAHAIGAEQFVLNLSDRVQGIDGTPLDGEWENPSDLADPLSASGPGDGVAGGSFQFRFNVLPGDANRDNLVDGADFLVWGQNWGLSGATFEQGDFNGDGNVDGGDFTSWSDGFGTVQTAATPIVRSAAPTLAPLEGRKARSADAAPVATSQSVEDREAGIRRFALARYVAETHDWLRDEAINGLAELQKPSTKRRA